MHVDSLRPLSTAIVLSATLVALISACSPSRAATAPPAPTDAGQDAATTTWATTPCGGCATAGCDARRQVCDSEPSCAAHSACVDTCGASPDGSIDPACLAGCPGGANAIASKSRAAYDDCLTSSGPQACASCPHSSAPLPSTDGLLAQKCGASSDPSACFKCEDERCCNTYAACNDEPECKVQLEGCLKTCGADGTAACVATCYADHPKGVATWAPRRACLDTRCITECGGPVPDPCFDCAFLSSCRDAHVRCASNEACFLLLSCLDTDCPNVTDTCIKSCKKKVAPGAAPLFDAWFACTAAACGNLCN